MPSKQREVPVPKNLIQPLKDHTRRNHNPFVFPSPRSNRE